MVRSSEKLKTNSTVQKAIDKGKIEWHMWGNVLSTFGSLCLVLGAVLGLIIKYGKREVFFVTLPLGILIFFMEWPRGARKNGRTMPRSHQDIITPFLEKLGFAWTNFYIRAVGYIAVAVPAFLELATIMGGVVLVIAAVVYIVAAFKKESWKPLKNRARAAKQGQIIAAPTTAPPRRPDTHKNPAFTPMPKHSPKPIEPRIVVPTDAPTRAPPKPAVRPRGGASPPKRAPPKPTTWEVIEDSESGRNYYHNTVTNETTWDMPAELGTI